MNLKGYVQKLKPLLITKVKLWLNTVLDTMEELDEPEALPQECKKGRLIFTMAGKWVDGTSLRDMMAGSTALAATWAATGEETEFLERSFMVSGPYAIRVEIGVDFEPLDEEYDGPIYNGAALVKSLQIKDGKNPVIN